MKNKTVRFLSLLFLSVILFLGGCSETQTKESSENDNASQTTDSQVAEDDVRVVQVGVRQDFAPICYLNDDGELEGFSYEMLVEIDNRLPQYEFEYKPSEFATMLTSLESGQVQMVESLLESNEEREEKFLYSDEPYFIYEGYIFNLDSSDFAPSSLPDLAGHKVEAVVGHNSVAMIDKYNELTDGEEIEKVTTQNNDIDVTMRMLETNEIDASFSSIFKLHEYESTRGEIYHVSDLPAYANPTYIVYGKEENQLKEDVDAVIKELKDDGTIDKLIEKYGVAPDGKTIEEMFETSDSINEINFGGLE